MTIKDHSRIIISILAILLFIVSCKENIDEKILARNDLVELLVELHCADAIITQRGLTGIKLKDSIPSYYNYILQKYNISRAGFNTSIAYYSEDVHEMLSIYDDVISKINNKIPKKLSDKSIYKIFDLTMEEATVKTNPDKWFGAAGKELWNKNKSITISTADTSNKLDYSGKLKYQSLLMLKANIIVYPDDSSKNLRMTLKVNYADKTSDIKERAIKQKDSKEKNRSWKEYQILLKTDSTKKTESLEAFVLQFDSLTGKRHIAVNNITLRQYGPHKDTTSLLIKEEPSKPVGKTTTLSKPKRNNLKNKIQVK